MTTKMKNKKARTQKKLKGEGLFDIFRPRDHYNNTSRKTLETFGDYTITNITLSRAPVKQFLRKAMDLITFGKFEEALRKYGHDRIFHLSAVVDVAKDGFHKRIVIEKNAVININPGFTSERDAEFVNVPVPTGLTLREMMENTQKYMGSHYFYYDPFENNCQHFIQAMLFSNGMLTPAIDSWLFQNMEKVKGEVSGFSKSLARGITHLGAVADRIIGNGKPEPTELEILIHRLLEDL